MGHEQLRIDDERAHVVALGHQCLHEGCEVPPVVEVEQAQDVLEDYHARGAAQDGQLAHETDDLERQDAAVACEAHPLPVLL